MNKKYLLLLYILMVASCSPKIIVKEDHAGAYSPLPNDALVDVLQLSDKAPETWLRIGEAFFGDGGFTVDCGLYTMTELAKQKARSLGADAMKIAEHKKPGLSSTCHQIRVIYYKKSSDVNIVSTAKESTDALVEVVQIQTKSERLENNIAIGYQIGGNTLIGIDHEVRLSESFGMHFGGGLAGFGAGIRYHLGPETLSSYYDLNYKDGGFGLFESVAFQFGGTLGKNSGLRYEIGLQKPLFIKKSFKRKLFDDKKAPPVILAVGIGWAW
ncbi:hypothetical protein K1X84_04105 [bacterium]|nr:hypothetical protein [bacterium]